MNWVLSFLVLMSVHWDFRLVTEISRWHSSPNSKAWRWSNGLFITSVRCMAGAAYTNKKSSQSDKEVQMKALMSSFETMRNKLKTHLDQLTTQHISLSQRNLIVFHVGVVNTQKDSIDPSYNNLMVFLSALYQHSQADSHHHAFYLFNVAEGTKNPLFRFLPLEKPNVGYVLWPRNAAEKDTPIRTVLQLGFPVITQFSAIFITSERSRGPMADTTNGGWIESFRQLLDFNNIGVVGASFSCDGSPHVQPHMYAIRPSLLVDTVDKQTKGLIALFADGMSKVASRKGYRLASLLYRSRLNQTVFLGQCIQTVASNPEMPSGNPISWCNLLPEEVIFVKWGGVPLRYNGNMCDAHKRLVQIRTAELVQNVNHHNNEGKRLIKLHLPETHSLGILYELQHQYDVEMWRNHGVLPVSLNIAQRGHSSSSNTLSSLSGEGGAGRYANAGGVRTVGHSFVVPYNPQAPHVCLLVPTLATHASTLSSKRETFFVQQTLEGFVQSMLRQSDPHWKVFFVNIEPASVPTTSRTGGNTATSTATSSSWYWAQRQFRTRQRRGKRRRESSSAQHGEVLRQLLGKYKDIRLNMMPAKILEAFANPREQQQPQQEEQGSPHQYHSQANEKKKSDADLLQQQGSLFSVDNDKVPKNAITSDTNTNNINMKKTNNKKKRKSNDNKKPRKRNKSQSRNSAGSKRGNRGKIRSSKLPENPEGDRRRGLYIEAQQVVDTSIGPETLSTMEEMKLFQSLAHLWPDRTDIGRQWDILQFLMASLQPNELFAANTSASSSHGFEEQQQQQQQFVHDTTKVNCVYGAVVSGNSIYGSDVIHNVLAAGGVTTDRTDRHASVESTSSDSESKLQSPDILLVPFESRATVEQATTTRNSLNPTAAATESNEWKSNCVNFEAMFSANLLPFAVQPNPYYSRIDSGACFLRYIAANQPTVQSYGVISLPEREELKVWSQYGVTDIDSNSDNANANDNVQDIGESSSSSAMTTNSCKNCETGYLVHYLVQRRQLSYKRLPMDGIKSALFRGYSPTLCIASGHTWLDYPEPSKSGCLDRQTFTSLQAVDTRGTKIPYFDWKQKHSLHKLCLRLSEEGRKHYREEIFFTTTSEGRH